MHLGFELRDVLHEELHRSLSVVQRLTLGCVGRSENDEGADDDNHVRRRYRHEHHDGEEVTTATNESIVDDDGLRVQQENVLVFPVDDANAGLIFGVLNFIEVLRLVDQDRTV